MKAKFLNCLLIPTLILSSHSIAQPARAQEWMQILPKGIAGYFEDVIQLDDGRWMISGGDRSYYAINFHSYEPLDPPLSNLVQHDGIFVGQSRPTGGILSSRDGINWTRTIRIKPHEDVSIKNVHGLWIVGIGDSQGQAFYSSHDGFEWAKTDIEFTPSHGPSGPLVASIQSYSYFDGKWIIAGGVADPVLILTGHVYPQIVFTSEDGLDWERIETNRKGIITHLSYHDGTWTALNIANSRSDFFHISKELLTATDLGDWVKHPGSYRDIARDDTKWILLGNHQIVETTDFHEFETSLTIPPEDRLELDPLNSGFVRFFRTDNGLFAINSTGDIYQMDDRGSWEKIPLPELIEPIQGIYQAGHLLYAKTAKGVCAISINGEAWQEPSFSRGPQVFDITFVDGVYFGLGNGAVQKSNNGVQWDNLNENLTAQDFKVLDHDGQRWIAGTIKGDLIESSDGFVWKFVGTSGVQVDSLAYGDGLWITGSYGYSVKFGEDNVLNVKELPKHGDFETEILLDVIHANDLWVAVGNVIKVSENGESWTAEVSLNSNQGQLQDVDYGDGIWAAVGSWDGSVYFSGDGQDWKHTKLPSANEVKAIAYSNGVWVVVGNTQGRASLWFSDAPGGTWQRKEFSDHRAFQNVEFDGQRFVVAGPGISSSADGKNWTPIEHGTAWFQDLAFGKGGWKAVTWEGQIFGSSDGLSWELEFEDSSSKPLSKIHYAADVWIAAGLKGKLLALPVGPPDLLLRQQMRISLPTLFGSNKVRLRVEAPAGKYWIEGSSNLDEWEPELEIESGEDIMQDYTVDRAEGSSMRFYRLRRIALPDRMAL